MSVKAVRAEPTIVGYWRQTSERDETGLPYPQQIEPGLSKKYFLGNTRQWFLKYLTAVEEQAHEDFYRGWSCCRLCGRSNGSSEFEYAGYRWPIGLRHYLEEHSVVPDQTWAQMIVFHGSRLLGD